MTPKSFPHCRMKSSSRHARKFKPVAALVSATNAWGMGVCHRGSKMLQLFAFRRSLRVLALALCSASIAVVASPASARPHHGRHARGYHAGHHARHYTRHYGHYRHRHIVRASRWERGVAQMQAGGFADTNATVTNTTFVDQNSTLTPPGGVMAGHSFSASSFSSSSSVVTEARKYLGGNPTGRGSLWCARFMNMVLQHTG